MYPKLPQNVSKVALKYEILSGNARKKFVLYKSTSRNRNSPVRKGFGGISIECLVILLYGFFPGFFCHQTMLGATLIPPVALSATKLLFMLKPIG